MRLRVFHLGFCALFFTLIFCGSGCSTSSTSDGQKAYFTGTKAFQKKLRKLSLNEDQARLRLKEHHRMKKLQEFDATYFLSAIAGDDFLFSGPRKAGVDLRGYYVNGHSGEVEFREPRGKQRMAYPPMIGLN